MSTPQDRAPIDYGILHHARNPASSLVACAMRSASVSGSFVREDAAGQVLADATSAPVVMTLPAGSDEWTGLMLAVVKTDASGNAVSIARSGSDTIEGSASPLSTIVQHERLAVYWDGSMWRRVVTGTGGGAATLGDTVIDGTLQVTGNTNLDGTTTLGTGGSAATFTPGASTLALNKALEVTGQVLATAEVSGNLLVENKAAATKTADTPFALAAGDRMLNISTTGAGAHAITAGDTLEVGQEVFIRMTAASGGGTYTMALADSLTATFAAAGDTLHAKHFGGGVWISLGGTAVVT